jgi:RimJ/RimL family protein N-acetyltransferase
VTVRPHGRLGDYAGVVVLGDRRILAPPGTRELQAREFWSAFARSVGLAVIGPSTHHYLDGRLVAAANLTSYADAPRDVGVLVVPDARGRRLVDEVGRAAASYAVSRHGFARWRARTTNRGSLGAGQRLGFEPWCTQLAIR